MVLLLQHLEWTKMLDLDMVPLILGNSYKVITLVLLREEKFWKKWLS